MKIHVTNKESFSQNKHFSLKKISKTGAILISYAAIGTSLLVGSSIKKSNDSTSIFPSVSVDVSSESINQMNIILNDSDCSDTFFDEVCAYLKEDGIIFTPVKNNEAINQEDCVVITLDQQYSSGSSTLIFAPYNNTRLGDSDSLALSTQAAFKQNGFFVDSILCGKIGYRQDENGNVCTIVPTETEDCIDDSNDTSFVTISFGTQNNNPEWVAKSIENALARQKHYLDNYDSHADLIYRANSGESTKVVAEYFNSTVQDLTKFNQLPTSKTLDAQTIVNPNVPTIKSFDDSVCFKINQERTKAY